MPHIAACASSGCGGTLVPMRVAAMLGDKRPAPLPVCGAGWVVGGGDAGGASGTGATGITMSFIGAGARVGDGRSATGGRGGDGSGL